MKNYLLNGFDNEIEKIALSEEGKASTLAIRHAARTALGTPGASIFPVATGTLLGSLIAGRTGGIIGAGLGLGSGLKKSEEKSLAESKVTAKKQGIKDLDKLKYVNVPVAAISGGIGGLAMGHIVKYLLGMKNKAILPVLGSLGAISGVTTSMLED